MEDKKEVLSLRSVQVGASSFQALNSAQWWKCLHCANCVYPVYEERFPCPCYVHCSVIFIWSWACSVKDNSQCLTLLYIHKSDWGLKGIKEGAIFLCFHKQRQCIHLSTHANSPFWGSFLPEAWCIEESFAVTGIHCMFSVSTGNFSLSFIFFCPLPISL